MVYYSKTLSFLLALWYKKWNLKSIVVFFQPSAIPHSQLTSADSVVPLMPNVLKVFLENGQTKSFKYDSSTTVQVNKI